MNKREMVRQERIKEIEAMIKADPQIDKKKLVMVIMAKFYISRRMAKEYLDTAETRLNFKQ